MTISKQIYTSKPNKDGSFPIKIRLEHRGKQSRISTGVSIKKKSHWKKDRVTSEDRDHRDKNKKIEKLYLQLKTRQKELEDLGIEPTFELIRSSTPIVKKGEGLNFIDMIDAKKDTYIKSNTIYQYDRLKNVLIELYGPHIPVKGIDQKWFDAFKIKLNVHFGAKNTSKNRLMTSFGATCKYIRLTKNIDIRYDRGKSFEEIRDKKTKILTVNESSNIMNAYKKEWILFDHNKSFMTKKQAEAMAVFMLMSAFQGIAPADIALLRNRDLKFLTIIKIDVNEELYNNDEEYKECVDNNQEEREVVTISLKRKKTESPVRVVADKSSIEPLLEYFYEGKDPDDYLIPCLSKHNTYIDKDCKTDIEKARSFDKNISDKIDSYFGSKAKCLDRYMNAFCLRMNRRPIRHIEYYMSRRFVANLLTEWDFNSHVVRRLLGQDIKTLEKHYLADIDEWTQSEITVKIFNEGKSNDGSDGTIKSLILQRMRDSKKEN